MILCCCFYSAYYYYRRSNPGVIKPPLGRLNNGRLCTNTPTVVVQTHESLVSTNKVKTPTHRNKQQYITALFIYIQLILRLGLNSNSFSRKSSRKSLLMDFRPY